MKIDLTTLCRQLGYQFQDITLLEAALTHRSVNAENNERLEFLGDSIVNFIIAEALFAKFPKAREGVLSRMRSNLVNGDTLAELAQEFQLSDYLLLGPGELKSGGKHRVSILADTIEAIIAAIYRDAGLEVCRDCVLNWYKSRLAKTKQANIKKDAKTCLQEYLQSRKLSLPTYTIQEIIGAAHAQRFVVFCDVPELKLPPSKGAGSSRRRAEQEAAKALLITLGQSYE